MSGANVRLVKPIPGLRSQCPALTSQSINRCINAVYNHRHHTATKTTAHHTHNYWVNYTSHTGLLLEAYIHKHSHGTHLHSTQPALSTAAKPVRVLMHWAAQLTPSDMCL
ncbi:hypothetical protein BsWGS_17050 [Bradybaena similaris]